jgi:hypothetical protein
MNLKTNLHSLRFPCLLAAIPFFGMSATAQTISTGWTIVSGTAEVERTAAQILQRELAARHHARAEIANPPAPADANIIYIGTPAALHAIAAEHAKSPFTLDAADPESYHAAARGNSLFIVGASPKGAMNGVFRFLEKNTADITGLDQAESPAFRLRVGGNLINNRPPPEWTDDMQAEYYASHYINTVWGEKWPPPLPLDARRKYGLGAMLEVRFPPENGEWMRRPENAAAVYENPKAGQYQRLGVSPFDPLGRATYLARFKKTLDENPDTRVLYGAFADYNTIPDEKYVNIKTGEPYGRSRADGIREILSLMQEAAAGRDLTVAVWMWHSFYGDPAGEQKFMLEMAEKGIGVIYNEAGNGDNWATIRDNFDTTALRAGVDGKSLYGDKFMPVVSAAGTCESTGPAVALPLPAVAAHKLSRLAEAGAKNFVLWWGGVEGWTYNANMEVAAQMIWNPRAFDNKNPRPFDEPLLQKIAARDFGPLAPGALDFWCEFDRAVVWNGKAYEKTPAGTGMYIKDWFQRLGVYIRPYTQYGAGYRHPLVPGRLERRNELKNPKLWLFRPEARENYRTVIAGIAATLDKLRALENSPDAAPLADARQRLADMRRWADLFRHLLASQLNFYRACDAMLATPSGETALRAALVPAARDEIANDESLIKLLGEFHSWTSASLGTTGVRFQKEPVRDNEIKLLNDKIKAMRDWLDRPSSIDLTGRPNLALNKPATSLSVETKAKPASAAVDGDRKETRWVARLHNRAPEEWWQVDLGAVQPVEAIVIYWTVAYAKGFEIRVSDDAPGKTAQWRSIYKTETGAGGRQTITLPENTKARQVRFVGQKTGSPWSYGFFEFEVY